MLRRPTTDTYPDRSRLHRTGGPHRRWTRINLMAILVGVSLCSALTTDARAATLEVCASGCAYTTIAAAVAAAQNHDTILLKVSAPQVHTEQGILIQKKILTISGLGRNQTVLQAASSTDAATSQVMAIFSSASVTVQDMTIRHGNTNFDGGAIAVSGSEGRTSDLVVRRATFRDNRANGNGGAIDAGNYTTLVVEDSLFEGNDAGNSGGAVNSDNDLSFRRNLVVGNQADFGGGLSLIGTSLVRNSTFFGNLATTNGGGISGLHGALSHVTVTGNSALGGDAAGVSGFDLFVSNSVMVDNFSGADCSISGFAGTYSNWDSDGTCNGTVGTGDAMLDPLRDNGGEVRTMAPRAGSPLINQADQARCQSVDQRRLGRSLGGSCDIGAYERFEYQVCGNASAPIPDNSSTGVELVLDVGAIEDNHRVVDVDALVDIEHTWVGDVVVDVHHLGSSVRLIDRPGVPLLQFGCLNDDILATLDSEATDPVEDECDGTPPAIKGRLSPDQSLDAFDGLKAEGQWTFKAADLEPAEVGDFIAACLFIDLFDEPGGVHSIFADGFESGDTGAWSP